MKRLLVLLAAVAVIALTAGCTIEADPAHHCGLTISSTEGGSITATVSGDDTEIVPEAFAQECVECVEDPQPPEGIVECLRPGWNREGICYRELGFGAGPSGLAACRYRIRSKMNGDYEETEWVTVDCGNEHRTECTVYVIMEIGPEAEDCYSGGEAGCRVHVYVENNMGVYRYFEYDYDIDWIPPDVEVTDPDHDGSWQNESFVAIFKYADPGFSGLSICQYRVESAGVPTYPEEGNADTWASAGDCFDAGGGPLCLPNTITVGDNGDCRDDGEGQCTVYVRAQDVAGHWSSVGSRSFSIFGIAKHGLIVTSTDGGRVEEPGEGTFTYYHGEVAVLMATPDTGYQFLNWTGDTAMVGDVNAAETTIAMDDSYSVTARFRKPVNWPLVGGIIAVAAAAVLLVIFLLRRRPA